MITVIIPNWNGRAYLPDCLGSLRSQAGRLHEVIVADNGSRDGSVEYLEKEFPEVRVIRFEENRGFCAAVNAGILAARGDYIALLNNDTRVEKDWLKELLEGAGRHPGSSFFASKVVSDSPPARIDSAGDYYSRSGFGGQRGHGEPESGRYEEEIEVFSPCGCGAFYRKELFREVGLFDESLFAFCEDVDLAFRARWRGFRGTYLPRARVYHRGKGTLAGDNPLILKLILRNRLAVMLKNSPFRVLLKNFPLIFSAVCYFSLRAGWKGGWQTPLTAYRELLRMAPELLKQRRDLMQKAEVTGGQIGKMIGSEPFRPIPRK
ncbi:MAG: glycosyltransferase family 2 protein [bacterium]|nr:glycosyltransferase family 2 protein [bacterium]